MEGKQDEGVKEEGMEKEKKKRESIEKEEKEKGEGKTRGRSKREVSEGKARRSGGSTEGRERVCVCVRREQGKRCENNIEWSNRRGSNKRGRRVKKGETSVNGCENNGQSKEKYKKTSSYIIYKCKILYTYYEHLYSPIIVSLKIFLLFLYQIRRMYNP